MTPPGGINWYLSPSGSDIDDCGLDEWSPCRSLKYVIPKISHGDIIYMKGGIPNTIHYPVCGEVNTIVTASFTVTRYGESEVIIGCDLTNLTAQQFIWKLESVTQAHVTLKKLSFWNLQINVDGVSHTVDNCKFVEAKLHIWAKIAKIASTITHSEWRGNTDCTTTDKCIPTGELKCMGKFKHIHITNCNLYHTKLSIQAVGNTHILLSDCVLDGQVNETPVFGGNAIAMFNADSSNVIVKRCIFKNQFHWNPIESVMNIFEASLLVRLMIHGGFAAAGTNNVTVMFSDTLFEHNERGLTFQGAIEHVIIDNCVFRSNIAMHAGAAILLLTNRTATIKNSTFDSNAAGDFRVTRVRYPGDHFSVEGDEVKIHSNCCKGSISLIGKGGAIRVQKGKMFLENCSFRNNTARLLGGAIFVDRSGYLVIEDTDFSNSPTHQHSSQGDMLYSNGRVSFNGGSLLVKSANNHISLLQHSGEHWSMTVHDITILCPIGHRLRVVNTSAYGVTPFVGLRRSYMLDQLSYFCESCPRHKYSTDRGYLRYKLEQGVYEYFTLMINGEAPNSNFDGIYDYHDIDCSECPYGAICDNTIRSLPNFWGYKYRAGIKFQQCPKGYCCSNTYCPSYNCCAKNRDGKLCSSCGANYSEALFSSLCVPSETCGPLWLWPFAMGMGLLYLLFLLYQKDARDFIFARPTNNICPRIRFLNELPRRKSLPENILLNGKTDDEVGDGQAEGLMTHTDAIISPIDGEVAMKDPKKTNDTTTPLTSPGSDAAPPDMGATCLIILMYYFQDALLFTVTGISGEREGKKRSQLKALLLGFFKFRLEVAHFVDNVCLLQDMRSWEKLLTKTLLVPYVISLFIFLYIVYKCVVVFRGKLHNPGEHKKEDTFLVRLSTGFMLCLLFTYQRLATSSFTLLNCVPVGDESVLFIDGSVQCYQYWQLGVIAYAVCCIVPFCFVLTLGPGLLKDGYISLPSFFIACILPFPFVIYWVTLRLVKRGKPVPEHPESFAAEAQAVYKVLQGPFKDNRNKYLGPECWAGVLIGRRLVLVLLFTFVNNSLIRVLSMLFVSFLVLLHHVHVQPYKDPRGNFAGSASVSAMMIVGGINLVRAGFEAAEYMPQGPNKTLMKVMLETENVLMLWFPLVIMCCVLLALTIKLLLLLCNCCSKFGKQSPQPPHQH